jgi:hypothetical protein
VRRHKLTPRENVHVIAALRLFGRLIENTPVGGTLPHYNPMVAARMKAADVLPMTLDEIETLIGRLDGTFKTKGLRPWEPFRYL